MPAKKTEPKTLAIWYAGNGWQIFPVIANTKQPLTSNGFKDASSDAQTVEAWWTEHPGANIGLACGPSGLIVIDGDPFKYTQESIDLIGKLWNEPPTPTQSTPADGVHFIYRLPADHQLNNSRGALPAGVDVRVNGYILLAQSSVTYRGKDAADKGVPDGHFGRYRWLYNPTEAEVQPLPDFILELLLAKPEKVYAPPPNGNGANHRDNSGDKDNRYARAALERELEVLNNTPDGNRNNQLNTSAMKLAQLVAGGELDESEVIDKLEIVARGIGLDESAIKKTIQSGFKKGKTEPRYAPQMPVLKFGRGDEAAPVDDVGAGEEEEETEEEGKPKKKKAKKYIGPSKTIQLELRRMGYSFQLNELRDRIELEDGTPLHDGEQATIVAQLFESGVKNKTLIQDVMLAEAWANRYDPLKDFLYSLEWDGTDYIEMLGNWFVCKNDPIRTADGTLKSVISVWLRRWLIGAVGKALGGIQNPMLVLAGSQGIGKSEFARWLCSPIPDYFVSSPIVPDNTDHLRWLAGNFIWEVAELGSTTRKADIEGLKAFLTRPECSYRVPYAKNEVHRPARASFVGTINLDNAGFLMDATGNRRFLSAELLGIQWEAYTRNIDPLQLWAQAAYLYRQDPNSWKLTIDEEKSRDVINEEYGAEDPILDAIENLYHIRANAEAKEAQFLPTTEIVNLLANSVHEPTTRQLQLGVAKALRRLNVTKGRKDGDRGARGYWGLARKFAHED